MAVVKVSPEGVITLPEEAQRALAARQEEILVIVCGEAVILLRKPENLAEALSKIAGSWYRSDYLKREQDS